MPENIVNILDSIKAVKGQEYVEGLVDMANLLAPKHEAEDGKREAQAENASR